MQFKTYDIAKEYLKKAGKITSDDSFDLAKLTSRLLANPEQEKNGRDLVIRVKDAIRRNKVDEQAIPMWNEITAAAGLFPYVDEDNLNQASLIRYLTHKSDYLPDIVFHENQLEVSMLLQAKDSVILSAPTSYGKSLLIEDVIASRRYNNIVIIQPTLALLDETRKKLKKYKEYYKTIVSTSQLPSEELGNIFLFTGERVVEYDNFPGVDFFVIDEFYKLSMEREDDRAIVLNQALYKLRKYTDRFYMLGPSIKEIPAQVLEKLGARWLHTEFATVAVDERLVMPSGRKTLKADRKEYLFSLLGQLEDPTLIYAASPNTCVELAIEYINFEKVRRKGTKDRVSTEISEMCEWIEKHIHKGWSLIEALKNGIGYHHGGLPRHLGGSIVEAFNRGHIKYLFCTATLIEGVNTSAKNVVLFDKKKGQKDIDFFDYKNIAGRSGRMRQHFIGNVFTFEKEPLQLDFKVDIPIVSQDNAPVEILLALDQSDLKPELRSKLDTFNQLPRELQQILKKNSTINIEGQKALVAELEDYPLQHYSDLHWTSAYPKYPQLLAVISLAWKYFAREEDRKFRVAGKYNLSEKTLVPFAFGYNIHQSLGGLISENVSNNKFWADVFPNVNERIDALAHSILQIARSYFDYKLPKWISVVNDLQKYVFAKQGLMPGDYSAFASRMENGWLDPALAALREYDIPLTAIRKLGQLLSDHRTPEENIRRINAMDIATLKRMGLLDYEIGKLRQA